MRIDLEEPFKSKWRYGNLSVNNEGRRTVTMYGEDGQTRWMSYARYLYSVHFGYEVPDHLEVDHVNDDKTDDRLENLQLLTSEQNRLKQEYNYIMNQQVVYGVYCAYCSTPFLITERDRKTRMAKGVEYPFCSRSCSASYNTHVGNSTVFQSTISVEDIDRIKTLRSQGMSSYAIARETGLARNTVMKYWK